MIYWTFSRLRFLGCWKNTCPSECRIYVRVRTNETFGSLQTCEDMQRIVADILRLVCRYVQSCADMHKLQIMQLTVPGHCSSVREDTCQSVAVDLSILRTIIKFLMFGSKDAQQNNSCCASFGMQLMLERHQVSQLIWNMLAADTANTVETPPEPHSKAGQSRLNILPPSQIFRRVNGMPPKNIGLNFVPLGHTQSKIKHHDLDWCSIRKLLRNIQTWLIFYEGFP